MSVIKIGDESFNFEDLTLANPSALQGGAYFSKIIKNGEPVYIQLPKCKTKNGIKKTEKNYTVICYSQVKTTTLLSGFQK